MPARPPVRTPLMRIAQLATLGALGLLFIAAGSAAAAEPDDCRLAVQPTVGAAGTQFTLSGEGYTPTGLTLQKNDGRETIVDLELAGADPFEIPIGSRAGDEGLWKATAVVAGTSCSATATFRVTLLSTDVLSGLIGGLDREGMPLAVYILVVAMGLGGGRLLAGRLRAKECSSR
jgi:hypothetical protein